MFHSIDECEYLDSMESCYRDKWVSKLFHAGRRDAQVQFVLTNRTEELETMAWLSRRNEAPSMGTQSHCVSSSDNRVDYGRRGSKVEKKDVVVGVGVGKHVEVGGDGRRVG